MERRKSKFISVFMVVLMIIQVFFQGMPVKALSSYNSISAPEIYSPDREEYVEYDDLKVKWDRVSGANYYKIGLRDVTLDEKIISDETTKKYFWIDKADLVPGHRFKVAVGAYEDEQNFKWGEPVFFNVQDEVELEPPYVYSIEDRSIVPYDDLEIGWERVDGASEYRVALRNLNTDEKLIDDDTTSTNYDIDESYLVPGDEYRLAVGAFNERGDDEWTEILFTVEDVTPVVNPDVIYPGNESIVEKEGFNVQWDSVEGASYYKIALRNLNTGTKEPDNEVVYGTNYYIDESYLASGDEYRLAVGAFNEHGDNEWTEILFTVEEEPVVISVELSDEYITLEQEESYQLGVNIYPEDVEDIRIDWACDNYDVIEVDNTGRVTAVGAGNAYVTVNEKNSGLSARCRVTVEVKEPDKATSVELSDEDIKLKKGESYQLGVKVYPENVEDISIEWGSDNYDVIEVDNLGRVTAVGPGTAYVTVYEKNSGLSAGCRVTVEAKEVVKPIITSPNDGEIFSNDENIKIKWKSESESGKHLLSIKDITGNYYLEERSEIWDTSYTIDKSSLEPGHEYKIAVAAPVEDGIENWVENPIYITVEEEPVVTTIETSEGDITLEKGESYQLSVKTYPENITRKKLEWTSYDSSIVNVDYNTGELTAISEGQTVVEVSEIYSRLTHSFNVTVKKEAIEPPQMHIFEDEIKVNLGEKVNLDGYIESKDELTIVSFCVKDWYEKPEGKYDTRNLSWQKVKKFDLSNFIIDTTKEPFNEVGEYEVNIWAKTSSYSKPDKSLGKINVIVKNDNKVQITAPNVVYPKKNSILEKKDFAVIWNSVKGASHYKISLENLSTRTEEIDNKIVYETSYFIDESNLVPEDKYRLSVGAFNKDGEDEWTEILFTVEKDTPLGRVEIQYPQQAEKIPYDDFDIKWNRVQGAADYTVKIVDLENQKEIFTKKTSSTKAKVYKSRIKEGGNYCLEVVARDKNNRESKGTSLFTVKKTELGEIKILSPGENDMVPFENLKISWNKVNGVREYKIVVSDKESKKEVFEKETSRTYTTLFKSRIKEGRNYIIKITGTDRFNNETSNEMEFTVIDKNKPMLSGFSLQEKTLKIGDKFQFNGYVSSKGKPVDTVTINIKGPNQKQYGIEYFRKTKISSSKYELKNVPQIKFGEGLIKEPGNYWIHVWAKNENGEGILLGEKKITVNTNKIGEFNIISPSSKEKIDTNTQVNLKWNKPKGVYGVKYNILIHHNNKEVHKKIGIQNTNYKIPAGVLKEWGNYYVDVYATKPGMVSRKSSMMISVKSQLSSWSIDTVNDVLNKGILDPELIDELLAEPKEALTRAEYCEMLVKLYESYENPASKYNPDENKSFKDISQLSERTQKSILKADAVGIMRGVTETEFKPDELLNRQLAATFLRETYYAIYGYEIDMSKGEWANKFKDESEIIDWAYESVRFANALGILNGSAGKFNPHDTVTHEIGLVIMSRAFEAFHNLEYEIKSYIDIKIGTPHRLECSYKGKKIGDVYNSEIEWSSTNPKIASTDGNWLYAKGKGNIELRAEYLGNIYTKKIKVNKEEVSKEEVNKEEENKIIKNKPDISKIINNSVCKEYNIGKNRYRLVYANVEILKNGDIKKKYTLQSLNIPIPAFIVDDNNDIVTDKDILKKIDLIMVIQEEIANKEIQLKELVNNYKTLEKSIDNYFLAQKLITAGNELSKVAANLTIEAVNPTSKVQMKKSIINALAKFGKQEVSVSNAVKLGKYFRTLYMFNSYKESLKEMEIKVNKVIDIISDRDKLSSYKNCAYINNTLVYLAYEYNNTWRAMEATFIPELPENRIDAACKIFGGFFKSFGETILDSVVGDYVKENEETAKYLKIWKAIKSCTSTTIDVMDAGMTILCDYEPNFKTYREKQKNMRTKYENYEYLIFPNTNRMDYLIENGERFK